MTRETALQILKKHLTNPILLKHSLAVEAVMRALAATFNGDPEVWGITGLLHDADYDKAKGNPQLHGILLFQLEPNSIPTVVEHAIKAHNFEETKIKPESPMDWALYCCDELTGLIFQLGQETKEKKLETVTIEMITKKLKDEKFIKKTHLSPVFSSEAKLGIPLEEFINTTLNAMKEIHEAIGV